MNLIDSNYKTPFTFNNLNAKIIVFYGLITDIIIFFSLPYYFEFQKVLFSFVEESFNYVCIEIMDRVSVLII